MRVTLMRMVAGVLVAAAVCGRAIPPGDRFVAVGDGVVLDRKTGLAWSLDYDSALAWGPADRHCRELGLGERSGWRLPEITELQALYDEHVAETCGERICHLDAAIRLASPWVWSGTERAGGRFYFDFAAGSSLSPGTPPTLVRRVLCVQEAAVSP